VTLVAGGAVPLAAAVAVAMTSLQCSIGATNDVLDAPLDRIGKPSKPIARGLVSRRGAAAVAVGAAGLGLGIAAVLGVPVFAVGAAGLCLGLAYDIGLKRTVLAWVPYALGLPLLPAFAWVAARQALPDGFPALVALGLLAGGSVALSNGLVDVEADMASGRGGLVVVLGRSRSLAVLAALDALLVAVVAVVLAGAGLPAPGLGGAITGAAFLAVGVTLSGSAQPAWRERGWEGQAVGLVLVALAWLSATQH
jgi:4-hydroxybenzoate polyprenyltransferase